jgi:hypothetical protein
LQDKPQPVCSQSPCTVSRLLFPTDEIEGTFRAGFLLMSPPAFFAFNPENRMSDVLVVGQSLGRVESNGVSSSRAKSDVNHSFRMISDLYNFSRPGIARGLGHGV